MSSADSITLDPHKGLFLPYGTGCLLVRDAKSLRYAFSQIDQPGYLPNRMFNLERRVCNRIARRVLQCPRRSSLIQRRTVLN
jgi:glutamate/tyrosine decarboxylase-like PLP-dependent enzyme